MSSFLILLHDDGGRETTIFVHGLWLSVREYDLETLAQQIHRTELRGRVFLFGWRSSAFNPQTLNVLDARKIRAAEEAGRSLARRVARLARNRTSPVTLVGHSQGTLVITSALEWLLERSYCCVEWVFLMGGVVSAEKRIWEELSPAVSRGIINVHSASDWWASRLQAAIGSTAIKSGYRRKIRNIMCRFSHEEYWPNLSEVFDRAWPTRRRSRGYFARVDCDCPACGADLIVTANRDNVCPDCRVEFEYRLKDARPYCTVTPKEILCSFCERETHWVQESAMYQCADCRKWSDFERVGNRVRIRNDP